MVLPRDMPSFEKFWSFIYSTYDFPCLPSYRNAVAAMIQHLGPQVAWKPPLYFAKSIRKAMSNQTAFEVMQRIKEDEKKAQEEEAKNAQTVVVTNDVPASDASAQG